MLDAGNFLRAQDEAILSRLTRTPLRPACFARYSAASAAAIRVLRVSHLGPKAATPILTVNCLGVSSLIWNVVDATACRRRSAKFCAASSSVSGSRTANSSP